MKVRALLLLAAMPAAQGTRYFLYQRPISGSSSAARQSCLVLDAGVFAHASPQLADLRLYRGDTETPYVVRVATPVEAAEEMLTPLNIGKRGQDTVFDASMPAGKYSDVVLAVTAQNFLATVLVSGSHAQTGTFTKLGSYTIFDLTDQRLGRSTVLHLPESDFRYLHFSLSGPISPQSVTGISVERLPAIEPKYVTLAASSQVKIQGHLSVVEFTVPAHVPVDRIVFTPAAEPATFTRDVTVTLSPIAKTVPAVDVEPAPAVRSSANLLRLHRTEDGHRIDEERLSVDAPVAAFDNSTKWTIEVENGSDLPLHIQSVQLEMLERNVCFQAAANSGYTLFYGDSLLTAPHYDYATLFEPQPDAAQLSLGAEQQNPGYQPRPDERPFTERHPALLWAALIATIALLAAIAFRASKPITKMP
jgi:hypothetical protein